MFKHEMINIFQFYFLSVYQERTIGRLVNNENELVVAVVQCKSSSGSNFIMIPRINAEDMFQKLKETVMLYFLDVVFSSKFPWNFSNNFLKLSW